VALLVVIGSSLYAAAPAGAQSGITEVTLSHPVNPYDLPEGMSVGPDGKIWVALDGASAIASVTTTPDHTVHQYPIGNTHVEPIDVHPGPDGKGGIAMWFNEYVGTAIGRIDIATGQVVTFTDPLPAGILPGTWDVIEGPDHNIWFTEYWNHSIGTMTPDGKNYRNFYIRNPDGSVDLNSYASELIVGPDHNIWFADEGSGAVGTVNIATGKVSDYLVRDGSGVCGLTVGPDGNIWFAEQDFGGGTNPGRYIGNITPQGVVLGQYLLPSGAGGPVEMTTGPDGNVWFAEQIANKLAKSDMSGHITEYDSPTPTSGPYGVVAGPDGNIWFSENSVDKVGIFPLAPLTFREYLPMILR
jgi:virginiamycin B lyase